MNEPNYYCANARTSSDRIAERARQQGFTLVEIMVVIVILGLLATLVVPNVIGMSDDAKIQKAQTDCTAIFNQAKLFRVKNGKIPSMEELTTPDEKGQAYLENVMSDPWDHEYMIRETDRNQFEVLSMGPDGSEGTEDDISSKLEKKQ
jgi:general secretion pathway protein G